MELSGEKYSVSWLRWWLREFVQIQQTVYLKSVYFSAGKYYLNVKNGYK